jgi:uncharacterized lipoprotein YmbA
VRYVSAAVLSGSLLWLAACGSSPSKQAGKLRKTQQSWEATAQVTTELWQRHALPATYARQMLDVAAHELETTRRKAEKLSR